MVLVSLYSRSKFCQCAMLKILIVRTGHSLRVNTIPWHSAKLHHLSPMPHSSISAAHVPVGGSFSLQEISPLFGVIYKWLGVQNSASKHLVQFSSPCTHTGMERGPAQTPSRGYKWRSILLGWKQELSSFCSKAYSFVLHDLLYYLILNLSVKYTFPTVQKSKLEESRYKETL